jgi:hypothetical protein
MNPMDHLRKGESPIADRKRRPRGHSVGRSRGLVLGGMWLRFRTWRKASTLDDELARGTDPLRSDELSLRTGQLRSLKSRARLARSLLGALELADREPPAAPAVARLIRRSQVRDCRALLLELVERLHDDWPPSAQGLAKISQLVTQGDSPLYEHAERSLRDSLRSALLALPAAEE